ncbi:MAG: DUF4405 domain-containing protein [Vulcanimicrobiota bacterium]
MKKENANPLVDLLALFLFVGLSATGLVLRWSLPPGSGRLGVDPSAHPERSIWLLWGLDRHQWGNLHYWVAIGLAVVLVVHLVLHRKWIVAVVRGRRRESDGLRPLLGVVGLLVLMVMALAPLVWPTQAVQRSGQQPGLTLLDLSALTGVPLDHLHDRLKLTTAADAQELTELMGRGELVSASVAEAVKAYYVAGGEPIDGKPDVYAGDCLSCHGQDAANIRPLGAIPDPQALDILRRAQPAGPHGPLRTAGPEELKAYLAAIRARQQAAGR